MKQLIDHVQYAIKGALKDDNAQYVLIAIWCTQFKTMFFVYGVLLLKVENYLSFVTQYYIQDINA